jgi:hypothetical protein
MGYESEAVTAIDAATGQPALPVHRDLRQLLDYWSKQRAGRPFPRREDIDPIDFSYMLSRIALAEVHEIDAAPVGQPRPAVKRSYRFRVVGSWWRDIVGLELTGRWIDDLPDSRMIDITVSFYEKMIDLGQPLFTSRDAWIDEKRLNYQIMVLPLSEDGQRISMIITGIGPKEG